MRVCMCVCVCVRCVSCIYSIYKRKHVEYRKHWETFGTYLN